MPFLICCGPSFFPFVASEVDVTRNKEKREFALEGKEVLSHDKDQLFGQFAPVPENKTGDQKEDGQKEENEEKAEDPEVVEQIEKCRKNARQVLGRLASDVVLLKSMFSNTATSKYTQELHADIKKLIPKYARSLKQMEAVVVEKQDVAEWQGLLSFSLCVISLLFLCVSFFCPCSLIVNCL